jgi:hypothetical protein
VDYRVIPAVVFLALSLYGCGKGVPAVKSDYVGEWRAREMHLLIAPDGTVDYKRVKGGGHVSVSGAIQSFKGDDFAVGLPFLSTTFVVSKPPYIEGGHWYMVVDGVQLIRTGAAMPAEPAQVHQTSAGRETAALRARPADEREADAKRRQSIQQSQCVYKPVMSDDDIAKCR